MAFNPEDHNFRKIDFSPAPGGVAHYERLADEVEPHGHDLMRLNVYLSQDGDFVNVWFGLLDPFAAQLSLNLAEDQTFDFREQYAEPLFRGYIEDDESGKTVLKALRLTNFVPQELRLDHENKLGCYSLSGA